MGMIILDKLNPDHHGLANVAQEGWKLGTLPDSFEVEEVPVYLPVGEGEHLYLWIEKKELSTENVLKKLSEISGIPMREMGTAGKKDLNAITRQWISMKSHDPAHEERLKKYQSEDVKILKILRHGNKLRTGHLKGNQFHLLVEGSGNMDHLINAFNDLCSKGIPNYYGWQRYGRHKANAKFGEMLVKREWDSFVESYQEIEKKRLNSISRIRLPRRVFYANAFQADMFNQMLFDRGKKFDLVEPGDRSTEKWGNVVPTGVLPGCSVPLTEHEETYFKHWDLDLDLFKKSQWLPILKGQRRPYVVFPAEYKAEKKSDSQCLLSFFLPSGSYASMLFFFLTGSHLNHEE